MSSRSASAHRSGVRSRVRLPPTPACAARARRAQATLDYLIVLIVILIIGLLAVVLTMFLPDLTLSVRAKQAADYWSKTARPFAVSDVIYRADAARLYMALDSQEDESFNLTGLYVNDRRLALFAYNSSAPGGIGALQCNASACVSGCACDMAIHPYSTARVVSENYQNFMQLCGPNNAQAEVSLRLVYARPGLAGTELVETSPTLLPVRCI